MRRRSYLAMAGSALSVAVSGCASESRSSRQSRNDSESSDDGADETESDLAGYIRPEEPPEEVPPDLDCPEAGFTRHPKQYDEVRWGDTDDLSLRVDKKTIAHGDTIHATLLNTSSEFVGTGTEVQMQVELYTQNGWKDVRGRFDEEGFQYTDAGYDLPPNEGLEWEFSFSENRIGYEFYTGANVEVCPDLSPGRYRLVFWGAEPALAVAFDLQ